MSEEIALATSSSETSASDDKCSKSELPDRDVYLKIKPPSEEADTLPFVLCPSTSFHEIIFKKGSFKFTEIFRQDCSQTEVFNKSIRKRVVDFINGKSSTILTYGAPDTGKTRTFYGTILEPGIVMYAVRLIFSKVRCTSRPWYKVIEDDQIVALNEENLLVEEEFKRKILDSCKPAMSDIVQRRLLINHTSQASKFNDQGSSTDMDVASVWISAISFVDDSFYNLLNDEVDFVKLSFREDGSAYLSGLEFVHITTAVEAYQLLIGIKTGHSVKIVRSDRPFIFTIKLIQYREKNATDTVSVSTLTFCNIPKDQSINLDSYMQAVYEGGYEAVWPFLESPLMLLLKRPLLDQEAITFLVTISIESKYEADTMAVLKTSSVMKKYLHPI